MSVQTLGLLANPRHIQRSEGLFEEIARMCRRIDIRLIAMSELAQTLPTVEAMPVEAILGWADVLLIAGGDGTILHAAALAARKSVPVLGLHTGTIGFFSEITLDELEPALRALSEGTFSLETRMMLEMTLDNEHALALNDVVISRGSFARMIHVDAWSGDTLVGGYDGDGLIVSSPTGSTGYSLSTGGAIIYPSLPCILLSPICAHSLQSRQILLPDDAVVRLEASCPADGGGMLLTVDGHAPLTLTHTVVVTVARARQELQFVRLRPYPFFERLRTKLSQWNR